MQWTKLNAMSQVQRCGKLTVETVRAAAMAGPATGMAAVATLPTTGILLTAAMGLVTALVT
jgi:hypothetical protein